MGLPTRYEVRSAEPDDAVELEQLFIALDKEEGVEPSYLEDDLMSAWRRSDFELDTDTFVVAAQDGSVAAYAHVESRVPIDLVAMAWVHPEHRDLGLGTYLVEVMEHRARAKANASEMSFERLVNVVTQWDRPAAKLLTRAGYVPIRHFWSMEMNLNTELAEPDPVPGVIVRTFEPVEASMVFGVLFEAFKDHWGANFSSFEDWSVETLERKGHDPTMWWVAESEGRLVGALVADTSGGTGWVVDLGVLRNWRGKGIARALLLNSFADFKRRGFMRVGLGVDSESPTGATRLYEGAGMTKYRQIDFYAKDLVTAGT